MRILVDWALSQILCLPFRALVTQDFYAGYENDNSVMKPPSFASFSGSLCDCNPQTRTPLKLIKKLKSPEKSP